MKKLFVLISIILILFLTGCGIADNTSSDWETNDSSKTVLSATEETKEKEIPDGETTTEQIPQEEPSSNTENTETSTEETHKKETSSTTESSSQNKTTSNNASLSNNKTTSNNEWVLDPNQPYTWYEENGVITYHQNGRHWNTLGEKWTDEDISNW